MAKNINDNDDNRQSHGSKWKMWLNFPLLAVMAVIIVAIFYGDNSYLKKTEYERQINELKTEIKTNEDSALYYSQKANELNTDKESLEKIAREQYGMKRDDEDVYITNIK